MKREILFCLFVAFTFGLCGAQEVSYQRAVIDTLTSSYMSGRGYVDSGQYRAALYLEEQYQELGLLPLNDNKYLQPFTHPVNTFPGRMTVKIGDKVLEPGKDFILSPSSGSLLGNFSLVWYDKTNIPERKHFNKLVRRDFFREKIIVLDSRGVEDEDKKELFEAIRFNVFGAPGIILIRDKKLTWGCSTEFEDFLVMEFPRGVMERKQKEIFIDVENRFVRNYPSQNVTGFIQGSQYPDSFVVFTAHYDHLGQLGDSVYFPGANDNASGTAMLLKLARHYKNHPPPYSVAFLAFGSEEAGLIGSAYYVQNPAFPLQNISFLWNFDILGTGEEGIKVVNGKVFKDRFDRLLEINARENYLPDISPRGEAAISDHYFFYEKGVPSFYSYTLGGIKAYHDVYDKAETLPLTGFEGVFRLVRDYVMEVTISE